MLSVSLPSPEYVDRVTTFAYFIEDGPLVPPYWGGGKYNHIKVSRVFVEVAQDEVGKTLHVKTTVLGQARTKAGDVPAQGARLQDADQATIDAYQKAWEQGDGNAYV